MAALPSFRAPGGVTGDTHTDDVGVWYIQAVYSDTRYAWGLEEKFGATAPSPSTILDLVAAQAQDEIDVDALFALMMGTGTRLDAIEAEIDVPDLVVQLENQLI